LGYRWNHRLKGLKSRLRERRARVGRDPILSDQGPFTSSR
jgi:hypothetical protein